LLYGSCGNGLLNFAPGLTGIKINQATSERKLKMKLDLISETKMPPEDDGTCTTVSVYLPDIDMAEYLEDLKCYERGECLLPVYAPPDDIVEAGSVENYVLNYLNLEQKIPCEPIPGRAYHSYFVYPVHSFIILVDVLALDV
jgi:hypothetical protein